MFNLEVGRTANPGMRTAESITRDTVSSATRHGCFDADMAALAACVGARGSEQAVLHLRNMRLRYCCNDNMSHCVFDN